MSYVGPGSIYSIGLHNIAILCFLLSVASGISIMAFWGRVQGKIGSLGDSLAATLFKVRAPAERMTLRSRGPRSVGVITLVRVKRWWVLVA